MCAICMEARLHKIYNDTQERHLVPGKVYKWKEIHLIDGEQKIGTGLMDEISVTLEKDRQQLNHRKKDSNEKKSFDLIKLNNFVNFTQPESNERREAQLKKHLYIIVM